MQTIRILTLGNSFAENALTYLEDMANRTTAVRIQAGRANIGGCSLEKHWNLAEYTRRHPEYGTYVLERRPDGTVREANLREVLAAAPWDYVTLQQVSAKSWRPETFRPHLQWLHDLVRRQAPQAEILLHQTWAYRSDTPFLPQHGLTQALMFERIRGAYALFAAELGCRVLPSGQAVQAVRETPGWAFSWPDSDFDYQNAEAPRLPRQDHSLTIGWNWAITGSPEGRPELHLDAGHLNARGRYLVGCVWLECLSGLDARSVTFVPDEMDSDTAAFLRETAHAVAVRAVTRSGSHS